MDSRICILLSWVEGAFKRGWGTEGVPFESILARFGRGEGKKSLDHTKKGASQWTVQGTRRQD